MIFIYYIYEYEFDYFKIGKVVIILDFINYNFLEKLIFFGIKIVEVINYKWFLRK